MDPQTPDTDTTVAEPLHRDRRAPRKPRWLEALGWLLGSILVLGWMDLTTPQTSQQEGKGNDGRLYAAMSVRGINVDGDAVRRRMGDQRLEREQRRAAVAAGRKPKKPEAVYEAFNEAFNADEQVYIFAHAAPFCYRVLTPWLASWVPREAATGLFSAVYSPWGGLDAALSLVGLESGLDAGIAQAEHKNRSTAVTGFRVIGFAANLLSLLLFWMLLCRLGHSARACIVAGAFFAAVFGCFGWTLYEPCRVEPLTQTLTLAVLVLLAFERYGWIPALLVLGVLQKEILLLMGPVVYAHRATRRGWRESLPYLVVLMVLPALTQFAVRSLVEPALPYDQLDRWWGNLRGIFLRSDRWPRLPNAMIVGLGALSLLVLARLRRFIDFLRRDPFWVLFLGLGIASLNGGVEKVRYFAFMVPMFAVFVAVLVDEDRLLRPVAQAAFLGSSLVLHLYLEWQLTTIRAGAAMKSRMVPMRTKATRQAAEYLEEFLWWIFAWLVLALLIHLVDWLLRRRRAAAMAT